MQKIKSLTLRNFKFFYGTETDYPKNKIELEENNLLLYGENGSGKSTVYWALYTFLQSCLKADDAQTEVMKQKGCNKKAHQKAGFNFFYLVTFTYSEEALPSITRQIYGFPYKNATIVWFFNMRPKI